LRISSRPGQDTGRPLARPVFGTGLSVPAAGDRPRSASVEPACSEEPFSGTPGTSALAHGVDASPPRTTGSPPSLSFVPSRHSPSPPRVILPCPAFRASPGLPYASRSDSGGSASM
jgi:hypothetical protein